MVKLGGFAVGLAEQSLSFRIVLSDAAIVVLTLVCFVFVLFTSLTAVVNRLTVLPSTVRGVPLLSVLLSVLVIFVVKYCEIACNYPI